MMSQTSMSSNSNQLLDTNDDNDKYYAYKIIYYFKQLPLRPPVFDNDNKILRLFAEKDFIVKSHVHLEYETESSIYLTNYMYNFSSTSDFMIRRGLRISVVFIRSRLKQKLKICFVNLLPFTLKIFENSEICKIRFVTHSNVQLEIKEDQIDNVKSSIAETKTCDKTNQCNQASEN